MKVIDIINKIQNKELSVKKVAEMYKVSPRTIQNKIKDTGYIWDAKGAFYEYKGEGPEPINVDFDSLFGRTDSKKKTKEREGKTTITANTIVSAVEHIKKQEKKQSTSNDSDDIIDILLSGNVAPKKAYRGFYFDPDVLSIIDSVPKNYKSELINEALRRVFKEKGLL